MKVTCVRVAALTGLGMAIAAVWAGTGEWPAARRVAADENNATAQNPPPGDDPFGTPRPSSDAGRADKKTAEAENPRPANVDPFGTGTPPAADQKSPRSRAPSPLTRPGPAALGDGSSPQQPASETELDPNAATERKLAVRKNAEYIDIPLVDFLTDIGNRYQVQTYIKRSALEDSGIGTDAVVPSVHFDDIRGDVLLELMLEAHDLVYYVRDGIVIVTTYEDLADNLEVRVYNCADLMNGSRGAVPPANAPGSGAGGFGGQQSGGMPGGALTRSQMPGMGGTPGAGGMPGMGMPGMGAMPGDMSAMGGPGMDMYCGSGPTLGSGKETDPLVRVITSTIGPETWQFVGGSGSIEPYYGGLLIVNNSVRVHREIDKLLQMIRRTASQSPAPPMKK